MKKLFQDDDTNAVLLNIGLLKMFGPECYAWEPETIRSEVERELGIDKLSCFVSDKIQAIATLLITDQFYDNWEVFEAIGKAFNHSRVYFDTLTPLNMEEATWTLLEGPLIDATPKKLSVDVKSYLGTVFKSGGLMEPPDPISEHMYEYRVYIDNYDKQEQKRKHMRIKAYCLLQAEAIIRDGRRYLGITNMETELKNHLPNLALS
jgi:hypothetical protein